MVRIEDVTEFYNEELQKNPKETERLHEFIRKQYVKHDIRIGEKTLPFFLTPHFITSDLETKLKEYSNCIMGILNKIGKYYFKKGFNDIREDDPLNDFIELNSGYTSISPISRLDLFVNGDEIKFLEFNTDSPSGIGRLDVIYNAFFSLEPVKKVDREFKVKKPPNARRILLKAILDCYKEYNGKENPVIAMVDWRDVKTMSDQILVKNFFCSSGYETIICSPRDLTYDGECLYFKDKKIDVVYKRVIAPELLNNEGSDNLLNAVRDGKVCLINPIKSFLAGHKDILHHLSNGDFDDILDEEEKNVIRKTIPWSRDMKNEETTDISGKKINLMNFVKNNKDSLVLKPSGGYGGEGVVIGKFIDQEEWLSTIKKMGDDEWIVQEFVQIPEIKVPIMGDKITFESRFININTFVLNGKYAYSVSRISKNPVINTSKGGGFIPTFVVG
ncbi:MAG: circularly permuted type 2 ATP-grasp protein [Candidatus Aenigmatarchaeota archaeon]